MYISRLCYDASVRLSVRLSVMEVHWHSGSYLSTGQEIIWEERLRNDSVELDVKSQSVSQSQMAVQ